MGVEKDDGKHKERWLRCQDVCQGVSRRGLKASRWMTLLKNSQIPNYYTQLDITSTS
jgi:hypothetical protein